MVKVVEEEDYGRKETSTRKHGSDFKVRFMKVNRQGKNWGPRKIKKRFR